MKVYNGIIAIVLMCCQAVIARLNVLDNEPRNIELLNTHEMRFCYISFVKIDGEKYIVKQKKSDCLRKLLSVVRDAVMAHYAEGFINAHQVDIIPAGKAFPGKPRTDWPATIHTIAPGKMIKAQHSPYDGMNIKQADIGFRRDMLSWMAMHPALVKIVAFDTFLCNHDRHRGNLFYNKKTASFCAIDMDSAFKFNLCLLACKNFSAMLNDKNLQLSRKEINVLIEYKKQLQLLIDKYKPEDTLKTYNYFAKKAGFVEGSDLYTEKFMVEIEQNKKTIIQRYHDVKKLVLIVDQLIKKYKKA
jgi:hypothetical protein